MAGQSTNNCGLVAAVTSPSAGDCWQGAASWAAVKNCCLALVSCAVESWSYAASVGVINYGRAYVALNLEVSHRPLDCRPWQDTEDCTHHQGLVVPSRTVCNHLAIFSLGSDNSFGGHGIGSSSP